MIKRFRKNFGFVFLLLAFSAVFFGGVNVKVSTAEHNYVPLAPITGVVEGRNVTLNTYLPAMFKFLIGVAAVLAVIMITIGGIQYMSTDAIFEKSEGKERIRRALGGLFLALVAWLVLQTINPKLLNTNLNMQNMDAGTTQTP